jgi:hypothetical protein
MITVLSLYALLVLAAQSPPALTDGGAGVHARQLPSADARPPIGWCCFYPFVDVGMDKLPESGASVLSVCSGGWGMGQVEGKIDLDPFDRQLAYAEKHNLRLAIIQEINPVYTPAWLRDKVKAAGESAWNAQDVPGSTPSISSPLFRREQENLLAAFVQHVRAVDKTRRVAFYHPGAEWWFPLGERYNPRDVAAFRQWLKARYRAIAALNGIWRSSFRSFDEVPAPRIDMMGGTKGRTGLAQVVDVGSGMQHCSWSTPAAVDPAAKPGADTYAAVTPGKRYRMSAWVCVERVAGPGVFLETAWVGPNGGAPVAIDQSPPVRGPLGKWQRLSAVFTAPATAGRAWLLLKFMGVGAARYDDVSFAEVPGGPELAPNPGIESGGEAPAAWTFQNWTGGPQARHEYLRTGAHSGQRCLRIEVPETGGVRPPYGNSTAAVHDWCTFWYDAAARYVDGMAAIMKRLDPSRPTVTYLTMSWAAPSEVDETQRSAIAPDVVAMNGKHIDAFGMQICSADKDPYRVIACLDLMRKYGKPLWAVDLVDFTSGIHIGPQAMDRITQAAIQHGAAGIIYCAWHIPTVLDYSFYPYLTTRDHARMIKGAMSGIQATAGMRPAPHGALLMPMLPATPDSPDGVRNDWRSFAGWYKLLDRLNLTVDLLTLRELDGGAGLSRYPWVLVPDCPNLSDPALRSLRNYVAHGGRVIQAGRFAQMDDHGISRTARSAVIPHATLPDLGREFAGDPIRDTHAGNTPPLFLWRTDGARSLRVLSLARRLVPPVLSHGGATVLAAPESVRSVRWAGDGREAIYLVNNGPAPARGIRLRIRVAAGLHISALVDMAPSTPVVEARRGELLTVRLPDFRSSCIVQWARAAGRPEETTP